MPFLLLLVLTLTCVQREWPAPPEWIGRSGSVLLTWCTMLLFGVAAWLAGMWWLRSLAHNPTSRGVVVRRYHAFRRWHAYAILVSYFFLVCFGGWGWFVGAE